MTREEAINWLKAISFVSDPHITEAIDMAIEALQADAVHGEWIQKKRKGEYVEFDVYVCSECGIIGGVHANEWNYCPSCGARMKGGAE